LIASRYLYDYLLYTTTNHNLGPCDDLSGTCSNNNNNIRKESGQSSSFWGDSKTKGYPKAFLSILITIRYIPYANQSDVLNLILV